MVVKDSSSVIVGELSAWSGDRLLPQTITQDKKKKTFETFPESFFINTAYLGSA